MGWVPEFEWRMGPDDRPKFVMLKGRPETEAERRARRKAAFDEAEWRIVRASMPTGPDEPEKVTQDGRVVLGNPNTATPVKKIWG